MRKSWKKFRYKAAFMIRYSGWLSMWAHLHQLDMVKSCIKIVKITRIATWIRTPVFGISATERTTRAARKTRLCNFRMRSSPPPPLLPLLLHSRSKLMHFSPFNCLYLNLSSVLRTQCAFKSAANAVSGLELSWQINSRHPNRPLLLCGHWQQQKFPAVKIERLLIECAHSHPFYFPSPPMPYDDDNGNDS